MSPNQPTPNIIAIVREHLLTNGYDGLLSKADCNCTLKKLMNCPSSNAACEPGYANPKKNCGWGTRILAQKPNPPTPKEPSP